MKVPIKILFISHSSGLYGAERNLLLLVKNINKSNFHPIVALPAGGPLKDEMLRLNIKTYEIRFPWWVRGNLNIFAILHSFIKEFIALIKLYKIIKEENIAIVYTNSIVVFSGVLIAFITKRPHIWHIREILHNNPDLFSLLPDKLLFRFISGFSARVVVVSNAVADQFNNRGINSKVRVIYDGIDFEELKVHNSYPTISGLKKSDWLVGVIGSLQKRKAQDDAIRAIKIVKETIPDIKLLLVGKGDESFTNYLKNLVSELQLTEYVIFTGHRNDVPDILSCCNVLLMTSWAEPLGTVALEAMALGVPVIGSNSGGLQEIIQEGITGFCVPPRNPQEIANKLIDLFLDLDKVTQMRENSKKIAKQRFSFQLCTQNIESMLVSVE